jgi:hypothetical protein
MAGGDLHKRKTPVKSKIPKESKVRKEEHKRYSEQIIDFWNESVENKSNFCFFCGKYMPKRDNIHHLRGRTGKYYLDKDYWVNAHNECHAYRFHLMSIERLMKEPWYEEFMNRLYEKDKLTWQKEKKKQEKAQLSLEIE